MFAACGMCLKQMGSRVINGHKLQLDSRDIGCLYMSPHPMTFRVGTNNVPTLRLITLALAQPRANVRSLWHVLNDNQKN